MSTFIKDNQGNYKDLDGFELINQFDGTFLVLDNKGNDISGEYETLKQAKQTIKEYKLHNKKNISGTMAKLKKGSKEAKLFMAKVRAKKKKVSGAKETKELKTYLKKKKVRLPHGYKTVKRKRIISGVHNDTKSHNYKINISGIESQMKKTAKEYYNDALNLYGKWQSALLVAKTKTDKNIIKKRLSEIKSDIKHYKKHL